MPSYINIRIVFFTVITHDVCIPSAPRAASTDKASCLTLAALIVSLKLSLFFNMAVFMVQSQQHRHIIHLTPIRH